MKRTHSDIFQDFDRVYAVMKRECVTADKARDALVTHFNELHSKVFLSLSALPANDSVNPLLKNYRYVCTIRSNFLIR